MVPPGPAAPVAYESLQGQRVNVLAARAAPGTPAVCPLVWWAAAFSYRSHHLLSFLRGTLPGDDSTRRVVVLDNASLHRSRAIREAAEERTELGIELWYLPPYAPELNNIERTFRDAKHQALPVRTYPTVQRLIAAIYQGFRQLRQQFRPKHLSMSSA